MIESEVSKKMKVKMRVKLKVIKQIRNVEMAKRRKEKKSMEHKQEKQ